MYYHFNQCYNDIKWITKGKVPSKSSYNKTGGGEKSDDVHLTEVDHAALKLIGPTAVRGHEEIIEGEVSFNFENNEINHESLNHEDINLPLEDLQLVFKFYKRILH